MMKQVIYDETGRVVKENYFGWIKPNVFCCKPPCPGREKIYQYDPASRKFELYGGEHGVH